MKCLIVYYSRTGKNRKIAELIKEKIGGDVEEIIDLKNRRGFIGWIRSGKDAFLSRDTNIRPSNNDPANYDLIIIGTPVWAGNLTPAVRKYLKDYHDKIKSYSLFSVSGFGEKNTKIINKVKDILKKEPLSTLFISERELKKELYKDKLNMFIETLK